MAFSMLDFNDIDNHSLYYASIVFHEGNLFDSRIPRDDFFLHSRYHIRFRIFKVNKRCLKEGWGAIKTRGWGLIKVQSPLS